MKSDIGSHSNVRKLKVFIMLDSPVFKLLAHNDTGQAVGHQGGLVIPAELEDYFPDIVGTTSSLNPTASVEIDATLVANGIVVGKTITRYQYQTWGGKRSPERRLTSNLGPLRNMARENDLVLFQRDLDNISVMTITLVRQDDPEYLPYLAKTGKKRWGFIDDFAEPVSNIQIYKAIQDIEEFENSEFSMLDPRRALQKSRSIRKARNSAFRKKLLQAYGATCAVTGNSIVCPKGLNNLDAAHIVPVEYGGSDDPRNGILLSKDMHWAFDKGLFTLTKDYKVLVGKSVRTIPDNDYIASFHGTGIYLPTDKNLSPHQDALEWHRTNVAA